MIDRQLKYPGEVMTVLQDLIQSGYGEWTTTGDQQAVRILWRKPEELAVDIYQWADRMGLLRGSICTLYELHSGEDVHGTSFQGMDEELLRRALNILERQGKCTIFRGDTSEEDGIKFS